VLRPGSARSNECYSRDALPAVGTVGAGFDRISKRRHVVAPHLDNLLRMKARSIGVPIKKSRPFAAGKLLPPDLTVKSLVDTHGFGSRVGRHRIGGNRIGKSNKGLSSISDKVRNRHRPTKAKSDSFSSAVDS
jgi:hypothetical protein